MAPTRTSASSRGQPARDEGPLQAIAEGRFEAGDEQRGHEQQREQAMAGAQQRGQDATPIEPETGRSDR